MKFLDRMEKWLDYQREIARLEDRLRCTEAALKETRAAEKILYNATYGGAPDKDQQILRGLVYRVWQAEKSRDFYMAEWLKLKNGEDTQ